MTTFWKQSKKKIKISLADKWFSIYIRLSYCDENGYVSCFTCGTTRHWKDGMHCGHYVTREKPMTRFHEKNCHPQCLKCNILKSGEQGKHGIYIDKRHGAGTAQKLMDLGDIRGQKRFTEMDLEFLSEEYKRKAKVISKQKGIKI